MDHIVPQANTEWNIGRNRKGYTGAHHWTNMAMACRSCNSRKKTTGLLVFLVKEHNRRSRVRT